MTESRGEIKAKLRGQSAWKIRDQWHCKVGEMAREIRNGEIAKDSAARAGALYHSAWVYRAL